jgi:predicted  nucleic acid-binding Zn-ribbon protein
MKKMNNILKMISQMDANANEIKLAKHEVQLANTFNQVVDKHKFLEKTINGYLTQFDSIKKWVQGSKQDVEQNIEDLKRIQSSLKELGFTEESNELNKYLASNIYKEYDKLYNSTK